MRERVDNNDHGGALRAAAAAALYCCNPTGGPGCRRRFRAFDAGAHGRRGAAGAARPPASADGGATTTIARRTARRAVLRPGAAVRDVPVAWRRPENPPAAPASAAAAAERRRHRWALTVRFAGDRPGGVAAARRVEARHFGGGYGAPAARAPEAGAGVAVGKFVAGVMAKFM